MRKLFYVLAAFFCTSGWAYAQIPGYSVPTTGIGLQVCIGPGSNTISGSTVTYAGSCLTMTQNKTNYGYLDSSSGNLLVNTTGSPAQSCPIFEADTDYFQVLRVRDKRVSTCGGGGGGGGTIGGSGTTNFLPLFTGASAIGNSHVSDNGSQVQITLPLKTNLTGGPTCVDQTGGVLAQTSGDCLNGSGTINFLPLFSGTSALGNSHVSDNGSTVAITLPLTTNLTGGPFCVNETSGVLAQLSGDCGNILNSGTAVAQQVGEWVDATHIKGQAAFTDTGSILHYTGSFNTAFYGVGNQAECNVDTVTGGANNSTTQNCADYMEGTLGLRSGIIRDRPQIIATDPWTVNFSPDWRPSTGSTNSTTCDDSGSNTNCMVAQRPLIFNGSALTIGLGPVLHNQNMSQGSLILSGASGFPAPVGKPTLGTFTCSGSGGPGGTALQFAVQFDVDLETKSGKPHVRGPSAYTTSTVNCTAQGFSTATTVTITAPTGGAAGSLSHPDFSVGVASALNGDYYVQTVNSGTVNTQNAATGGCAANCVTFVSGTNFNTQWATGTIVINSVTYNISSIQSATLLTLGSAPGTQSGVAYKYGMSCGVASTIDATNDCKTTGNSVITLADLDTVSTSFPMPADNKTGQSVDITNPMIVMGPDVNVSFLEQYRDIALACPESNTGNNPNVLIYNISGQEGAGTNNGTVQIYGACGGYSGFSGAFIYSASQTPNSTWSQLSMSGGPTSGANIFYGIILDGRGNGTGGASGAAREISNTTIALKGGGTGNLPILAQGFRVKTDIINSHFEATNGNEAVYITNGAHVNAVSMEASLNGAAVLHYTSTAGFSAALGICPQGVGQAFVERCQAGTLAIQDDTTGGAGALNGYQAVWASGGSSSTFGNLLATGTITFSALTGGPFCLHETAGVVTATASDCGAGGGGSNPMTTLGDMIVGAAAGAQARLAGPTTPNSVAQVLTSTPSAGNATTPAWNFSGVPVDATNPATLLVTDRANFLNWTSGSAQAWPAVSGNFASNFVFSARNTSGGTLTFTPNAGASDLCNGAATCTLLDKFFALIYQDSTSAPGHWFEVPLVTASSLGSTCGTFLTWSTTTGIGCATVPASAAVVGTNGSSQIVAATGANENSIVACADSSGSSTAQVCNTSPTFTPTANNACINYTTTTQNSSALTLNVNSLGAKSVVSWLGTALVSGDIKANKSEELCYDGTNWNAMTVGNPPPSATAASAAKQVWISNGADKTMVAVDFPEVLFIPSANCNNATAGAGWGIGSGGTVTCRAGTNNLGGFVAITDTSSTFATFQITLPEDWDSTANPYIRMQVASTDATNGHTVIPSIQVGCYKGDGTTTDDVASNAAHSLSTITLNGNANRFWSTSNIQMNSTDVTGCVAGALMQITVGRATDTATNARFYGATVTIPRLITVQAN